MAEHYKNLEKSIIEDDRINMKRNISRIQEFQEMNPNVKLSPPEALVGLINEAFGKDQVSILMKRLQSRESKLNTENDDDNDNEEDDDATDRDDDNQQSSDSEYSDEGVNWTDDTLDDFSSIQRGGSVNNRRDFTYNRSPVSPSSTFEAPIRSSTSSLFSRVSSPRIYSTYPFESINASPAWNVHSQRPYQSIDFRSSNSQRPFESSYSHETRNSRLILEQIDQERQRQREFDILRQPERAGHMHFAHPQKEVTIPFDACRFCLGLTFSKYCPYCRIGLPMKVIKKGAPSSVIDEIYSEVTVSVSAVPDKTSKAESTDVSVVE